MNFIDLSLSSWVPTPNSHLYRRGSRDPMDRVWNYEDRYDFFTIIYDAFWSEAGDKIMMICPALSNLQEEIFDKDFYEMPSGKKCELLFQTTGPICMVTIPVSEGTKSLKLVFSKGTFFITPQPNLCEMLKGERFIVTISKNNALHWMQDWMYFHAKMHGCTGLILYDNASERYSTYDIREALEPVPGLKYVVLVDAPFPYGVNTGPFGVNDSRFLTTAALEHARLRLARRAAGLMHIDVDELVVSEKAGDSVFDAVENSKTGSLSFEGVWVERVTEEGIEPPVEEVSQKLFHYIAAGGGRRSARKTAISPARVDDRVYITTHRVYGTSPDNEAGDKFKHRHFTGLKTVASNIKNKERLEREPFQRPDPAKFEKDPILVARLAECFGSDEYRQMQKAEPYAPARHGDICRRYAGIHYARGDMQSAMEWIRKAIGIEPNYPSYHQFLARCLEDVGLIEEAAAENKIARDLLWTSPQYRAAHIRKLRFAGAADEADRESGSLLAAFPDYAQGHAERAEVLQKSGDPVAAELEFRKAAELDGGNARILMRWGALLLRCRRPLEAADIFRRILGLHKVHFVDRAKTYKHLSAALEAAGQDEAAHAVLREALETLGKHAKMTPRVRRELQGEVDQLASRIAGATLDSTSSDGSDQARRQRRIRRSNPDRMKLRA